MNDFAAGAPGIRGRRGMLPLEQRRSGFRCCLVELPTEVGSFTALGFNQFELEEGANTQKATRFVSGDPHAEDNFTRSILALLIER